MVLTKEQALSLYQPTADPPKKVKTKRYSNLQLLRMLSSKPLDMVAETFLRPKMAIKYHLLPALAQELAFARPLNAVNDGSLMVNRLARSVALLLETANPAWHELPESWISVGLSFDCKFTQEADFEIAYNKLKTIFSEINIGRPMRFLEKFCEPLPEMAVWRRFFWLSDDDCKELLAEKIETIKAFDTEDQANVSQE